LAQLADSVADALRRERSKPPSNVVKMRPSPRRA
jgi:hypothetical protein